jgi:hypothetical protein
MRSRALVGLVLTVVLSGCPKQKDDGETLTAAEALQAVEESTLASQAENLTSASVELTTNFTIGQAVQNAAQEIQTFIQSQLPCAEITLADATLTVKYGVNPGKCTYRNQTFSGTHTVHVSKNDNAEVVVEHTWAGLTNGRVSLDGNATVTWNFQDKTRHVVHTADWTRVADGFKVTGQGDRTQSVLEGGLIEGIQVDGSRSWTSTRGDWDLSIEGVQMRWIDPVPQAGSYTLLSPKKKILKLSFDRVDEDTIKVTIANGNRSFAFDVTKAGAVNN